MSEHVRDPDDVYRLVETFAEQMRSGQAALREELGKINEQLARADEERKQRVGAMAKMDRDLYGGNGEPGLKIRMDRADRTLAVVYWLGGGCAGCIGYQLFQWFLARVGK